MASKTTASSTARATAEQIMQRLDARDLDGVVERSTQDARFHGFAPQTLDSNGYHQMMSGLLNAFPDSRFPIDDIVAEGNRVAVRHHMEGTHQKEFQGIPPTGKRVRVDAIVLFQMEDDRAKEVWLNADFLGLMQQLGVGGSGA